MKKKLLAVAVVGALASPLAFAQNVTLYGGVDMGLQHADAGQTGAKNFVVSGQWYTSRFGLKASDDIGNGLYALLQLEHGIAADTGTGDDTVYGSFWQRTSMVGLGNKAWGELTLGRQYTHMFNMANQLLPLTFAGSITASGTGGNDVGAPTPVGGIQTPSQVRADNYVKFSSANFSGFNFGVGYATNGVGAEDTTHTNNGKYWDAHVGYAMKPFSVDLAHSSLKADTGLATSEAKRSQITGMWDSGAFGVFAGFAQDKSDGAAGFIANFDQRRMWIQPVARFGGNNEVYGLYGQMKDKANGDLKTTWIGVSYRYLMSKRTFAYATWGQAKNDNTGTLPATSLGRPQNFAGPALAAGKDKSDGVGIGVVLTF